MPQTKNIAVRGAGVAGLWQALTLARRGHKVTLCERSPVPFMHGCSLYAGAMLAPNCEKESADAEVRELGLRGLALWRETYSGAIANGTLVVALHRDRAELDRFARMTEGHQRLSPAELAATEPALIDRFAGGLYYAEEGHLSPEPALHFLLEQAQT
ncbi:MAG TPA: FAD-dependent oxidoreductase, partial [Methyloceanibacter sp.]|nr:FAD-dependent oxidoreductase [Methyloceanibacter sp.]